MTVSDKLNRRWTKANRKAKGGWYPKSKYYADQQQQRLLHREKGMTYGTIVVGQCEDGVIDRLGN